MSLAYDLLAQAQHLARWDAKRPKQASLRRAVSTAYYALFHLLSLAAVQRIAPVSPPALAPRLARTLEHSAMLAVCKSVSNLNPDPILFELVPAGFSVRLRRVAVAFVELQGARHRADYDLAANHNRLATLELVRLAEVAFADWQAIADSDEATVFLYALLFARRWSKGA